MAFLRGPLRSGYSALIPAAGLPYRSNSMPPPACASARRRPCLLVVELAPRALAHEPQHRDDQGVLGESRGCGKAPRAAAHPRLQIGIYLHLHTHFRRKLRERLVLLARATLQRIDSVELRV